ncbi:DUF971 domain-containing protein [Rubinisphaera italica]|uniref:Gamma-butyrobetaine dioxygenase n=1 Tax=Rubinisphaera italica TaxID=2527969 RepID=A0A5C5XBJ9_9PLAN|nr:DUF971 domain-containing protein [Rubinisphaera italica]TWT60396.1 Gamma-butyrobetaine dioxygenase [Rubinisphaera italica]
MSVLPPESIKAQISTQVLEMTWQEQEKPFAIPFRVLRGLCPCAVCVNEMTGVRTYFVDDAPEDIQPEKMELIGNYAVKILWSDGHTTGLYTWEYLKKIQRESQSESQITDAL